MSLQPTGDPGSWTLIRKKPTGRALPACPRKSSSFPVSSSNLIGALATPFPRSQQPLPLKLHAIFACHIQVYRKSSEKERGSSIKYKVCWSRYARAARFTNAMVGFRDSWFIRAAAQTPNLAHYRCDYEDS